MNTPVLARVLAAGLWAGLLPATGFSAEEGPPPGRETRYWVAPERTPGALACRRPAAVRAWVVCDRWPDGSDVRRFGQDAIRLCGARSDHEQCLAVYRWIRRWMIFPDKAIGPPTEKLAAWHHKRGFVDQGLKQLNVYGVHWCDGQVRVMEAVWRSLGYRAEKVVRGGHTIAGCHYADYDGTPRWHALDVSHSGLLFDRSHRRLLSLDELSTAYYNGYYQWIFCPHNAWDDHRMELAFRAGEKIERIWGNWGRPYHDNAARGDTKVPRAERGPYEFDYGNGRWTYTPDLAHADWVDGLAETPVNMVPGRLQPAKAAAAAAAVWDFRTPYIVADATVRLRLVRRSAGDRIRLHLSIDGGQTWKPLWECPADVIQGKEVAVTICEKFRVTGEASPPAGFHSPFGRYAYRLKLELFAREKPEDCRVEGLSFETVVQQNFFALPQLQPGRNRITVRASLAPGAALQVTYLWQDPLGPQRTNVTVVEQTPWTYEILAAGRRWEDCVCKSILVEAVRATGEGNRTLVKERPGEIHDLPPMGPVEQTATHWYQPGPDERPPVEQLIENLRRRRDLKRSLSAAAVLADKKERSKWDPRKDPTGEAPWIAATAVIGYMAADSGWKEFLPLEIRALASPAAGPGWGPRYGLLRVIGRLGHGDPAAARAIREVLADPRQSENVDARAVAALAAGQIGDPASIPALRKCLASGYEPLKHHAMCSLGMLGDREVAPKARQWLAVVEDENYRGVAAAALANLGDKDSAAALKAALAIEPFDWVRHEIEEALKRVQ